MAIARAASASAAPASSIMRARWRFLSLSGAQPATAAFVSQSHAAFYSTRLPRASSVPHCREHKKPWAGREHSTQGSTLICYSEMTANEMQMREDALKMANAAIRAVDPYVAVSDRLRIERGDGQSKLVARAERDGGRELAYDLSDYDNVRIVSFGKASAAMAMAAADIVSQSGIQMDGVVIIKDDHATDEEIEVLSKKHNILVRSASHPVPDARSVAAANEILELALSSCSRTLVLACISGGGSALFCSPREPLTLEDLMSVNSRLLSSGMPIESMNVIRKRLERGKGGRLAAEAYPATVLTLVLSDIIGDPLDLIASGPTVPDDASNWDDAYRLVEEYGLNAGGEHELPKSVLELLQMGRDDKLDDTPKSSHPAFSEKQSSSSEAQLFSETILVGNNDAAVMAAAEEAEQMGYNPVVLGTRVDGDASCVAGSYVSMAEMLSRQRDEAGVKYPIVSLPAALIAGGETTVTLPPECSGKGGRNQELALSAALKMKEMGLRDVVLASVGTDGTDGPTDAAGAIVHGGLLNEELMQGAKRAMREHDAYTFFNSIDGTLVRTGPTGTNVADICITLIK